jgi:uncharacterized protein involved in exopolysaccharide biosynthesis
VLRIDIVRVGWFMSTREIDAKASHETGLVGNDGLITIHDIATVLSRSLWIIFCAIFAAMGLAALYLWLATPMFTAKSQLLIEPYRFANVQLDSGITPIIDNIHIEGQLVLLRSGRVAREVVVGLGLAADPEFCGITPGTESDKQTSDSRSLSAADREQCAIGVLQKRLVVRRLQTSSAIEVLYSSPDPEKAKAIANKISDVYLGNLADARTDIVRGRTEWLQGRIDGLRQQMNEAVLAVQAFQAKRDYRLPDEIAQAERSDRPSGGNAAVGSAKPVSLEELQANARTYSKMYEAYLEALTRSLQEQSFGGTEARIISTAEKPLRPSSPRLLLTLALALALGTTAGLLIAFVRGQMNSGGRS